jgi:diguanylate cyclase (GGDEF)-like protein/putative nucleotidyltransferase with HDIG domain
VVLVLVVVSAMAVWGATETSRSTAHVEKARNLDDLYERASHAVQEEAAADAAYVVRPGPAMRERYNDAARELILVLDLLEQHGDRADRHTASDIAALHAQYLQLDARLFSALDRGDRAAVGRIDTGAIAKLFAQVREAVDSAAATHRKVVAERIDRLRHTTRLVESIVPAACLLGIVLVAIFASIMVSYRRQAQEAADREITRLAHVAQTDNLTGLGNHRALHEDIAELFAAADVAGEPFAVLALDLDGLKLVNDTLGHHDGDRLILRFVDGLVGTLPERARAYRVGGDEFIATLPGHSAIDAFHYSQHLQTTLAPPATGVLAPAPGEEVEPTHVSVGICDASIAEESPDLTLHRADLALIEAKRTGQRGLIWSAALEQPVAKRQVADHKRMLATALAKAVDAKDSYTRSHCETVAQLAVLIAEQLGMDTDDIEQLRLAGLLHDVGKIGVPDAILQKPGGLTDDEYAQMQEHSTLGHSIVAAAGLVEESTWVRHHHERLDGRGYPDQLAGEDIPLQSRIIFVADAFEAITSDRPYRRGRPVEEALAELERCAGTQFDEACVSALIRALSGNAGVEWTPASASVHRLPTVRGADEGAGREAA